MADFSDFGLCEPDPPRPHRRGIYDTYPDPIRSDPESLEGRDLCGIAQTGTGKTAAFALPILQRFFRPTASDTAAAAAEPSCSAPRESWRTRSSTVSAPMAAERRFPCGRFWRRPDRDRSSGGWHAGVDILVATPGRLLDLIERKFARAVERRGSRSRRGRPDARPRLYPRAEAHCEAGAPAAADTAVLGDDAARPIADSAEEYLTDPVTVAVRPAATTVERVDQSVVFVPSDRKARAAREFLRIPRSRGCWSSPEQTWCGPGRAPSRRRRHRGDRHPRQQIPAAARTGARRLPLPAHVPACSWPPTSPRAGSMSRACRMSSISSCRTCRKIMSIGSAEPRAPVRRRRDRLVQR